MLSVSPPPPPYPCEGLYDLTLHFGGEQESLPQDCLRFQRASFAKVLTFGALPSSQPVPHQNRYPQ
ncbi:MAG: hypothetical protein J7641_04980 [Cyanobacteria bacterium SID2]|nr:hypothetical protein [Cyanobacteria bacterium SID2]MBP0006167.1 hypothetical protein [Cyanobacteria bacterium SBC]